MISDVLAKAMREIERYQRERSDAYADLAEEINVTLAVMDGLRIALDSAPCSEVEHAKLLAEVCQELRRLDVAKLAVACKELLNWVNERSAGGQGSTQ